MKKTDPHDAHQNCIMLFERLSEYIDRELDAPTCREIEGHIAACKPCQVCLETLKQTVNLCRNLKRHQAPDTLSHKLKDAISDLVQAESDGSPTRWLSESSDPYAGHVGPKEIKG